MGILAVFRATPDRIDSGNDTLEAFKCTILPHWLANAKDHGNYSHPMMNILADITAKTEELNWWWLALPIVTLLSVSVLVWRMLPVVAPPFESWLAESPDRRKY